MEHTQDKQREFLQNAAVAAVYLAVFWLFFRYLLSWTAPFLVALLLSTLLEPLICWCQQKLGFRRSFSSAVFTVLFLLLLSLLLIFLFSRLLTEAYGFLQQFPSLLDELSGAMDTLQQQALHLSRALPEQLQQFLRQMEPESGYLSSLLQDAAQWLLTAAGALAKKLPSFGLFFITTLLALFFISCQYPAVTGFLRRQLPRRWQEKTRGLRQTVHSTVLQWCRAQLLLLLATFLQLLAGFLLLRQDYALLLSFFITLLDALPVLGTAAVLLPWAAVELLLGRGGKAVALVLLCLVTVLVHNLLEPKLMAEQAALPPIATLFALYVGFSAFGLWGMLLCPVALLFLKQLHDKGNIRLWK